VAIESQPVDSWQSRALSEERPQARVTAAVALSHVAPPEAQAALIESLLELDPAKLNESQTLGLLRAYALCFIRLGEPDKQQAERVTGQLAPSLPAASNSINTELVRLLVYLDAPDVVEKTLQLMTDSQPQPIPDWAELIQRNRGYGGTIARVLDNHPPTNKIAYAFLLRNVRYGWSLSQRRAYFEFINRAAKHPGGASYSGFLQNMRADALKNCSEAERAALASLTGEDLDPPPPFKITPPQGPGRKWTTKEALAFVTEGLRGRDFKRGRNIFYAAKCAACHLFDGYGGDVGPDLSTVRNKFSHHDLLEAIVEPSKVISDQYRSQIILTQQGQTLEGLVVDTSAEGDDNPDAVLEIYLSDPDKPPVKLKKSDVDEMEFSRQSQMPNQLIDSLSPEELLDLIAYLLSRGNADSPEFRQP
jgi:putative heme-binding domain-containing protein